MRATHLIVFILVTFAVVGCGSATPYESAPAAAHSEVSYGGAQTDAVAVTSTAVRRKGVDAPGVPGQAPAPASIDQKLVKNAVVRIRVRDEDDYEPSVAKVVTIARGLEGYVQNQTRSAVVFKVPSGRLDEALAAVAELGKVTHRDVSAVDVTAQYVDLDIRIENLKRMRVRLQQLLEQGTSVEALLEVEKELGRVTMELEMLEGRMRLLQNQVSFATINVYFEEKVMPGPLGWVFYGGYKAVKWLFVWD